jgi:hypothetical protein
MNVYLIPAGQINHFIYFSQSILWNPLLGCGSYI